LFQQSLPSTAIGGLMFQPVDKANRLAQKRALSKAFALNTKNSGLSEDLLKQTVPAL
jgi:hypothetical protein